MQRLHLPALAWVTSQLINLHCEVHSLVAHLTLQYHHLQVHPNLQSKRTTTNTKTVLSDSASSMAMLKFGDAQLQVTQNPAATSTKQQLVIDNLCLRLRMAA